MPTEPPVTIEEEMCRLCGSVTKKHMSFSMPNNCSYALCEACVKDEPEHIFNKLWEAYLENPLSLGTRKDILKELNQKAWLPTNVPLLFKKAAEDGFVTIEDLQACLKSFEKKSKDFQRMIQGLILNRIQTAGIIVVPSVVKEVVLKEIEIGQDPRIALLTALSFSRNGTSWIIPEQDEEKHDPEEAGRLIEKKLRESIDELEIHSKSSEILREYGIFNIGQLCELTEAELSSMLYMGKLRVIEIKEKLAHFGLSLAKTPRIIKRGRFQDVSVPEELEIAAQEMLGSSFPLWKAVRDRSNGWKEARDILVQKNLGLARKAAYARYRGRIASDPAIDWDDLFQDASFGVWKAVERFDYTMGSSFSTYGYIYAFRYIDNGKRSTSILPPHVRESLNQLTKRTMELLKEIRRRPTVEEIAERMGLTPDKVDELIGYIQLRFVSISLDAPLNEDTESTLLDKIADSFATKDFFFEESDSLEISQLKEKVVSFLEELPLFGIDKSIVEMRLGLKEKRYTLQEISEIVGITRERVRQRLVKVAEEIRSSTPWRLLQETSEDTIWANGLLRAISSQGFIKAQEEGERSNKNAKYAQPITRQELELIVPEGESNFYEKGVSQTDAQVSEMD